MDNIMIVIPARGGSKRIPNKNLQEVGGRSLLVRAIDTCLAAGHVPYVSTEDGNIMSAAVKAGAMVINRPEALAGDKSTTDDTLIHAVFSKWAMDSLVVCVHCTTPFVTPKIIKEAIDKYKYAAVPPGCVMAVKKFARFVWGRNEKQELEMINMKNGHRPMTQDWPEQYIETGVVHVVHARDLIEHKTRTVYPVVPFVLSEQVSLDIDTMEDLEYARYLEMSVH